MKIHLVLVVCCAATILAAPVDENNKEKIQVDVKPVDLQLKVSPTKIEAKLVDQKVTPTTSKTEVPVEEPKKEEKPEKEEEPVKVQEEKVNKFHQIFRIRESQQYLFNSNIQRHFLIHIVYNSTRVRSSFL